MWDDLVRLKNKGLVSKIGFSLDFPREIDELKKMKIKPDLIQIPYNIFDQRFADKFPALKDDGVEIHARSAFLQGLLFKKPEELNPRFAAIRSKLVSLNSIAAKAGVAVSALCLCFGILNPLIDRVIIGVDNIRNLKENLAAVAYAGDLQPLQSELLSLREDEERIILPFRWNS